MNLSWSCPARTILGLGGLEPWLRAGSPQSVPVTSATVLADPAVVGLPILRRLREVLQRSGVRHEMLTVDGPGDLEAATLLADRLAPVYLPGIDSGHAVIGVGGGSLLDQLKIAAVLQANPGAAARLELPQRSGLILLEDLEHRLPLVAIPSTLGTGAEASSSACLSHGDGKRLLIGDILRPDAAVLDPMATRSLPHHLVAEGVLEPLFRLTSLYIADHRGLPTEDALTVALAERLIRLGDELTGARAIENGAESDDLRLELAKISALSHAAWLSLGRNRYSARGWYIANELSTALGVRKMTAVAVLLPSLWSEIAAGQDILGSADRLSAMWPMLRAASSRDLPADPIAGIAALLDAWSIGRHVSPTREQVERTARRSIAAWGAGLPMLGRLRSRDVRRILDRAVRPVDRPTADPFPPDPSMDVGARRHRGLENNDYLVRR